MASICNLCSTPCEQKCSKCCKVYYCSVEHQKEDWKTHRKHCHPIKIETHPYKGRTMIATKDLKPYDLILKEESLVNIPSCANDQGLISNACISCLTHVNEKEVKPCSKCGWPVCGTKCENDKAHAGQECPIFFKHKIRPDSLAAEEILQVTRCIFLKKNDPVKFKALMNLESNLKTLFADFGFISQCAIVWGTLGKAFESVVDYEEMMSIVGILNMNAFHEETETVQNTRLKRVAGHLYATSCITNHSCSPNAKPIILKSGNLRLLATKEIKAGDEITVTYCPLTDGNLQRQEHIKRYQFSCRCERCLDPTELGTFFSSVKCGKCPSGFASPKSNKGGIEWICGLCSSTKENQEVKVMLNKIEKEVKAVTGTAIYNRFSIRRYEDMRQKCEEVLHPNHFLIFDLEYDFAEFLHNYHNENPSDKKLLSVIQKMIVKIVQKLMNILNKISPGPRLIRGRLLYFLTTGLADDIVMNRMTDGFLAQMGNKKNSGKPKLKVRDPDCIVTYKNVVSEAVAILELEPPEAEDRLFANELRKQLGFLP